MKVIGLNDHMKKLDGWCLATMETGILSDTGKAIIVGTNIDTAGIKNMTEIIKRVMAMATTRITEMPGLERLYNGFCNERTKEKPLAKLSGFNQLVRLPTLRLIVDVFLQITPRLVTTRSPIRQVCDLASKPPGAKVRWKFASE